jgi:predicted RNase H-like HicB family nuclease
MMRLDPHSYLVVIEGDGTTNFSAYAPDLPGCVTTGATIEETEARMRQAISLHIESLREHGDPVPPPTIAATAMIGVAGA